MLPSVAMAQAEGEPEPEPEAGGDKVELKEDATPAEEDTPYDFSNTGEENPDDRHSEFNKKEPEAAKKAKKVYEGYPTRVIDRPLTLPSGTSEVEFSTPAFVDPYAFGATLRASYAVTSEVQIGLRYGLGALTEDGFDVGKAVAIDAQYRFTKNISAQLSVPMFLDPFAAAVTLGVPMKFTFFDKFSLLLGEDLANIRAGDKFIPSIDNARQNAASILLVDTGSLTSKWQASVTLRAVYQKDDKLALDVQGGTQFDDDSGKAATTLLNVGALKAHNQDLDFGARLGALDLSHFIDTFGFNLFVRYRI